MRQLSGHGKIHIVEPKGSCASSLSCGCFFGVELAIRTCRDGN